MSRPDITAPLTAHLIFARGESVPIEMALQYLASDPYAVKAVFSGDSITVEWVFGRDLLRFGLLRDADHPMGLADVRVWSTYAGSRPVVIAVLSSTDGEAVIELDGQAVRDFLAKTTALVDYDAEKVDMDPIIAAIMSVTK